MTASTTDPIFITSNARKADEVQRLLAGCGVRWGRVALTPVAGDDLARVASARALEAYGRLGQRCFVENASLRVCDARGAPVFAPRSFKRALDALGEAGFCAAYGGLAAVSRVAVAYAEGPSPEQVRVFEGELDGAVARVPEGDGGYGWDRLFVPDGYAATLATLAPQKYLLNMRARPYLELADVLRGRGYGGTFEAHVTVSAGDAVERERFRGACEALGVKCIYIELAAGAVRSQPMTASFHRGELGPVQAEVMELAREFVRRGFAVTRTKIEALGRNRDVPETDDEARARPDDHYFEYHVKVRHPVGLDLAPLRALCASHGAHLSANARSVDPAGVASRFVTQRVYRRGRAYCDAGFDALVADLARAGFALGRRQREYAVYDSDVGVDHGWIAAP